MAKAAITQKMSLNANGILAIGDGKIGIENVETGELIMLDKFSRLCRQVSKAQCNLRL
jgi:hypothetical protein